MGDGTRMALRDGGQSDVWAVYHVVEVDGPVFVAACDKGMALDSDTERAVSATSGGMRCRRPACAGRWRAAEAAGTALDRSPDFHPGHVYLRDASWHQHSNGRGTRSGGRRYHWPRAEDPALSVCSSFTALAEFTEQPAAEVDPGLRCGRPGCRKVWAAFDRDQETRRG